MSNLQIDKNTYTTDARFQSLRDAGVSYEDFSANQSFYLRKLSTTNIMDLYNKGKQDYAKYTALYNEQNNLFIQLNNQKNEVVVGTEKELYSTTLYAEELNFLLNIDLSKPIEVMAKVRYRAKLAEATLYPQVEGKVKVEFKNPQRAITPGQSVVFYIENILLGGGKISSNV